MNSQKIVRAVCGLGAFVIMMAGAAMAQTFDKRTEFTFNRPITLPGVTLPAGRYLFRLADPNTTRDVVQVLSADGKTPYAMLLSIPAERPDASMEPEVRFMETPAGTPSAVKTWWYTGERTGYEFIYPKEQARLLAQGSTEPVLTTRSETTKPEDTKTAELSRLAPSGQETTVAVGPARSVPRGVRQPGTVASPALSIPAPAQIVRNQLPKTASPLPLVGLIGVLALVGGGSLRLWRTVRG